MKIYAALVLTCICSAQSWNPRDEAPAIQVPDSVMRQVVDALCPGQGYVGNGSGCHVCPKWTGFAGTKMDARIFSAMRGHFSAGDADEMLVVLNGCEPHSENFIDVVLFTKKPRGWVFDRKLDGGPSGSCRKLPDPAGREGLLCFIQDMHFATWEGYLSFGYVGGEETALVSLLNNTAQTCEYGPKVFVESDLKTVTLAPHALSLTATCRKYRKVCAKNDPSKVISSAMGPMRTFRLDYEFNDGKFRLAPGSEEAKRALDACVDFDGPPTK